MVPLVVVTGFLGSGKTTLINRLLARRAGRGAGDKLGVIVNELGAIGIDGALLGGESVRQIELPGGCVCCVLGDELDRTLIDLVERAPGLSAIVLETTGAAEPLPIAWAVGRAPVNQRVRLAAVVTLVDALEFLASREVSRAIEMTMEGQVAYADVVLVTKAELASTHETDLVLGAVQALAPRALIRVGTTDDHAAWLEQILADPELDAGGGVRPLGEGSDTRPHGHAGSHVHDDSCRHRDGSRHGIDSVWVAVPGLVDLEELEDQLGALPGNYLRIKGIVQTTERWVVVHRVGLRVSSEPLTAANSEPGRLVALGPAVDAEVLAACIGRARL